VVQRTPVRRRRRLSRDRGLSFILEGAGGSSPDPPDLPLDLDTVFPRPRNPFLPSRPWWVVDIWSPGDVLGARRMQWSLLRGDERVDAGPGSSAVGTGRSASTRSR
jgi:hypothetical protein